MIQNLKENVMHIQYSEAFGLGLSLVSAVLLAMLTEMLIQHVFKDRKNILLKLISIYIFIFGGYALAILLLLAGLLHFFPKGESLFALLKSVMRENAMEFIIPMLIALFVGGILGGAGKKKRLANMLLCLLLACSVLVSSIMFFWNSFRMIQRPQYAAPIESVSSIINSRLRVYPFILSGDMLEKIGNGEKLIQKYEVVSGGYDSSAVEQQEEYSEPSDFRGYIFAISDGTYAPGMGVLDYLDKAYTLYLNEEHQDDFFCIGLMWNYIFDEYYFFGDRISISEEECLEEAIAAYKRFEELYGGEAPLYNNMAIVYEKTGDRGLVREYNKKALEFGVSESAALSNYIINIYSWIDDSVNDLDSLMRDAETILTYEKNLSMYILYGACAIAENRNVEAAYHYFCDADEYFEGKSTMVKILRCICADLISVNDMATLHEIYDSEKNGVLTQEEEGYLIRYLFATDRYEELWGYIMDAGAEEGKEINAELIAIKADWYFKNPDRAQADIEDIRLLLQKIEDKLDESLSAEDRNFYLLAQTLLKNCIGEEGTFDLETGAPEEVSGLQYVFLATSTFNEGDYDAAIGYCKAFFDAEKNKEERDDGLLSLKQLEPQEQITLHNYIQLISAHSHFEYAKEFRKGSEEWKNHMETAEKECDAFDRYSKSMVYIEEQFRTLRNSIDIENGILPENRDETGKSDVEVD